jgi:hypothetical protein
MNDVGKFYGHMVYFSDILYILWPFGIFCGHFSIFFLFWFAVPRKIWQLCFQRSPLKKIKRKIIMIISFASRPSSRRGFVCRFAHSYVRPPVMHLSSSSWPENVFPFKNYGPPILWSFRLKNNLIRSSEVREKEIFSR